MELAFVVFSTIQPHPSVTDETLDPLAMHRIKPHELRADEKTSSRPWRLRDASNLYVGDKRLAAETEAQPPARPGVQAAA
jgi:hypothetical protein